MPCEIEEHAGYHNWPEQGDLRIWPCERACDYCTYQARDSSALRAHVRDVHQPANADFPMINILPGLNRPPVFDPMLHGTPPRPSREAPHPYHLSPQEVDVIVDQVEDSFEPEHSDQQQQPTDGDPQDDEYHDGPSSSAARGRRIQFTPKAAAAAEENARKRKRGGQRIPGEIFPARMPKPASRYSHPYGPSRNGGGYGAGNMADMVRVRGPRPRDPNRSAEDDEDLVSWFKSNINGMFYLGHAAGLSRREIVQSCQEIVNTWTFIDEDD
ncbi:hypothetical protein MPH_00917 [Macrophomina phaseolina MS6]|uniref:Uncharacterized protein n=2 Tax=Macrophomina phaseolina TaxID=35725 RepID=K2RGS6_MACPH|nr:hypothetical protein MPH_00917 [Macrophomina phaseolina MS6]